ncbi:hypothetical protein BDA99DRAFT_564807 [Phascolomyces articulosus]|uniref:Uncharacterized protein n=1 Tax=Phascolomyces articulosus TaxID=60185 RepID=A0AAD5JQB8_9FUNG|nr:hypothetical protein BDA99DRAFT_564807 [Phascolomyces articulosus]
MPYQSIDLRRHNKRQNFIRTARVPQVRHPPTTTSSTTPDNNNNNVIYSSSTTPTASLSLLGKLSRSSSSKSDSYELTQDMKEQYKQAYEALDHDKKWILDGGTKFEDIIAVHSFILGTNDECWESVFTPSQLEKIKPTNNRSLCEYNESCKTMFSAFSQVIKDAKKRKLVSVASSAITTTTTIATEGKRRTTSNKPIIFGILSIRLGQDTWLGNGPCGSRMDFA